MRIDVDVNDSRRIIHGRTAQMIAPMTIRSATGGRRRSVNAMAPIPDHATIWSAYRLIPYHGSCGSSA